MRESCLYIINKRSGTVSAFTVLFILFLLLSCSQAKTQVNAGHDGIAIKGFDPVAYFTMGRPVKGSEQFTYEWKGARWLFSSGEHLDLFTADPEKYAPKYGGYCAYAVSQGTTADIDPDSWSIVDGKLYLNLNKDVQKLWSGDMKGYIEKADRNWPAVIGE
jgi:YHS domain-containing protein